MVKASRIHYVVSTLVNFMLGEDTYAQLTFRMRKMCFVLYSNVVYCASFGSVYLLCIVQYSNVLFF